MKTTLLDYNQTVVDLANLSVDVDNLTILLEDVSLPDDAEPFVRLSKLTKMMAAAQRAMQIIPRLENPQERIRHEQAVLGNIRKIRIALTQVEKTMDEHWSDWHKSLERTSRGSEQKDMKWNFAKKPEQKDMKWNFAKKPEQKDMKWNFAK